MNNQKKIIVQLIISIFLVTFSFSQAENVPANNPVYDFLKRAEVTGLISNYHDAVLPLSRKQVAEYLVLINSQKDKLSETQLSVLNDFLTEFEFDVNKNQNNSFSLLGAGDDVISGMVRGTFQDKEKYIYTYSDTNLNLFTDGLLALDYRRSRGNGLNGMASYIDAGFRIRGVVYEKLGYYLQLTNAQFWGDRDVLRKDKRISQSYALGTLNAKNFDFVEGYIRYSGGIISAEIGRERILWGNSYGTKLILSDFPRVYDAVRFDAEYKNIKYTFLHAWILGKPDVLIYNSIYDSEPIVADKYFAAHRLEYSFGNCVDLGLQEITIYSNRSVDLGYLNPVTFFESVQRSRQERDNGNLAFDIQVRPVSGYEFQGTLFYDDIHIDLFGTNRWENRMAYQLGFMMVDPLGIANTNLMIEYTRVEPYTFAHNRSRENSYSSNNVLLGTQIGPNAESWFFRLDNYLTHRINLSARFEIIRSGENIYDSTGGLIKNVGGDFLQPFRNGDNLYKEFLGGYRHKRIVGQCYLTYELMNEIFLDFRYEWTWEKNQSLDLKLLEQNDFGCALRIDF
jgi:hypothetical protein